MERRTFMTQGLAAASMLGLSACNHYYGGPPPHAPAHGRRYGGPPPHAPAHGYRHKHHHHGVDLVFDSGLGVYIVAGLGHYYHRDRFYRWRDGIWLVSVRPRGPWRRVDDHAVPRRLYGKYKGRGRGRGKGRGRGRGRGREDY